MRHRPRRGLGVSICLSVALLLGACVDVPNGPSVMALPGTGKSSDQFRDDDWYCRNFANDKIGDVEPSEVANASTAKGAAVGTAVGAGIGAAAAGASGAGLGAGIGLLFGGMIGAGTGEGSAYALQRRYDEAYVQCMYSKGHKVPVSGHLTSTSRPSYVPPPPPPPSR